MVCVGLSERDLKNFGGPGKILGGSVPPWNTPSSAPACSYWKSHNLVKRLTYYWQEIKVFVLNQLDVNVSESMLCHRLNIHCDDHHFSIV